MMYCSEMLVARLLQMAGGTVMDWLLTYNNHAYILQGSNLFNTLAWQQNTFTPNIFLLVFTDGPS